MVPARWVTSCIAVAVCMLQWADTHLSTRTGAGFCVELALMERVIAAESCAEMHPAIQRGFTHPCTEKATGMAAGEACHFRSASARVFANQSTGRTIALMADLNKRNCVTAGQWACQAVLE